MSGKFVAIGLLPMLLVLNLCYNEAVVFKFTNFVCESFDKSWFIINECRLRAVNRNKTTLNFNGTFHQPVSELAVTGQILKKANGYKPWLYKAHIDACRFRKKAYNPIAILVFNFFKDFSNLNHTCPYDGTVFVKGLHLNWNRLPNPIPTGDYLLTLTWQSKNTTKFTTNVYFLFKEDLIYA